MKQEIKNKECLVCSHLKRKRIYEILLIALVIIFLASATTVIAARKNTERQSLQRQAQLLAKATPAIPATPGTGTKSIPESWCSADVWCGEQYCTCSSGGPEYGSILYIFEKHPGKGTPATPATPASSAKEETIYYPDCFGQVSCGEIYCGCSSVGGVRNILYLPRTLQRGSSGNDVKRLQRFLKQLPEIYPEGYVTGYYGPQTESAVRRLEMQCSLTPSGVVAPKLVVILNELIVYDTLEICGTLRIQSAGKSPLNR